MFYSPFSILSLRVYGARVICDLDKDDSTRISRCSEHYVDYDCLQHTALRLLQNFYGLEPLPFIHYEVQLIWNRSA